MLPRNKKLFVFWSIMDKISILLYIGYRKVWHVLKQQGIPVKRKTVMELVCEIDPVGVSNRKKRKA